MVSDKKTPKSFRGFILLYNKNYEAASTWASDFFSLDFFASDFEMDFIGFTAIDFVRIFPALWMVLLYFFSPNFFGKSTSDSTSFPSTCFSRCFFK